MRLQASAYLHIKYSISAASTAAISKTLPLSDAVPVPNPRARTTASNFLLNDEEAIKMLTYWSLVSEIRHPQLEYPMMITGFND